MVLGQPFVVAHGAPARLIQENVRSKHQRRGSTNARSTGSQPTVNGAIAVVPMATRGKIASQVSAARTWIDGVVRGDESEGPVSGRVQMGLPATANRWPLQPDVLLGDGAVLPPRQSHHPTTVLELADHAGPVS